MCTAPGNSWAAMQLQPAEWLDGRADTILMEGPQDVSELTTDHIIFVSLCVNAGTWSVMH